MRTLIFFLLLVTPFAQAANGTKPNGKPFVEINNEIIAVRGELSSIKEELALLRTKFTSIEAAQAAIDFKQRVLEEKLYRLQEIQEAVADDVSLISSIVQNLESEVESTKDALAAQSDLDQQLIEALAIQEELLSELQLITDGVVGSVQVLVDRNVSLLDLVAGISDNFDASEDLYTNYVLPSVCPAGYSKIDRLSWNGQLQSQYYRVELFCKRDSSTVYRDIFSLEKYLVIGVPTTLVKYLQVTLICPNPTHSLAITGGSYVDPVSHDFLRSTNSLGGWTNTYESNGTRYTSRFSSFFACLEIDAVVSDSGD